MNINGRKVCILTSQYPPQTGGLGHSTHRIAHMLADHGLTTHVVALRKSPYTVPFDESITTSVEGAVTVHRTQVWCPDWRESLRREGPAVSEANVLTRYNREMFDILNYLQTRHGYDVFHAFFLYPAGFIAAAAAKYHGVKSIVSIRGNDVGKYMFDPLRRGFVQCALQQADYVTSVATSLLEVADHAICPLAGRSRVILNSVDPAEAEPQSRPDLPLRGMVLGSAGLFRYKKGLLYLFKALVRLKDRYDFTLLLAGDFFNAEERQIHLKYLEDLGLTERTVVTGRLPHHAVFDYMQLFDIVIFPSLFAEGCPLSMLEAMAVRRPVIASRTGAIPEVIRDGESGLLVAPGSPDEIYRALVQLLEDNFLRNHLGEGGYRRVQELSADKELSAWLDVYRMVLDEGVRK